jgi:hypothetical protein
MGPRKTTLDTSAAKVARTTGRHAGLECITLMAGTDDRDKCRAIFTNFLEEVRVLANPSASQGAADVITEVMFYSRRGGLPPEEVVHIGTKIGQEFLECVSEPGVSGEQAVVLMKSAITEVLQQPHHSVALEAFTGHLAPMIRVMLEQVFSAGKAVSNAKP